ncbi:hypothetical protein KC332_g16459 [Hortaea werneckii]|uniref:2',3'-cyclic-nucleotide 3'-phosphodiesterase n=2 Tax=Hortaea werneckii TaxID=91943 RepID=A0A3M7INV5_HORWE|nr:hypothetical protein KC350_g16167 [Hortaea werneckii]KAI6800068.1 hypothetical protein KC358_g15735 [Hortaea werneckii]KAI6928209.1 hypothetical protein KC341_g11664 [Hortaea werneckii]KAI6947329.1 hypothetical protein KC348_g2599 [Hortaea werneckii]KAI6968994.1 hypothetical protein KC321_g8140 [Hortaea werneckii]
MPGSSLWLVPPKDSALYKTCHQLITTHIPSIFFSALAQPVPFTPHVTLTADTVPSDLFPDSTDPAISAQKWLDSIDLPPPSTTQEGLKVKIQNVQVEGPFFRKLTLRCEKSSQLCELAGRCRAHHGGKEGMVGGEHDEEGEEVEKWVRESYAPHLSLMYSDLPEEEVQLKLNEVDSEISQVQQANPESLSTRGGEIWLVPTYRPIEEWQPIAKREIPYGVEWEWQT